jgi:hypothetical protein
MINEIKKRNSSSSLMGRSDLLIRESALLKYRKMLGSLTEIFTGFLLKFCKSLLFRYLAESFRMAVVVTNHIIEYEKINIMSTRDDARKRARTQGQNSYLIRFYLVY